MADLFQLTELASLVQSDLDTASAALARDMATGVVQARIGTIPDPAPAALKAVALRVAAKIYTNPTALKAETVGGYSYSAGDLLDAADVAVLGMFSVGGGFGVTSVSLVSCDPMPYSFRSAC